MRRCRASRGCSDCAGSSDHYSARALEILAKLEDPAAEIWVFNLLGLSGSAMEMGGGRGPSSPRSCRLPKGSVIAGVGGTVWRTRCHRSLRGNWKESLNGLAGDVRSPPNKLETRDIWCWPTRERAYCHLQLGDLRAVEGDLRLVSEELDRGLAAEELPTRDDLHAIAATLALERGDFGQAAREADAAMEAIAQIGRDEKVANAYWSIFLVARVFANAWLNSVRQDAADRGFLTGMAAACRALSNQAWSNPIAAPSAAIARGYLTQFRGRRATAERLWRRAAAKANRLDMSYEVQLSLHALGEAGRRNQKTLGFPFLIGNGSADAR